MPLARVKESCLPCRQRKSRCNAESPCSSCVLRGTENDCYLPSQLASDGTPKAGPSRERRSPGIKITPTERKHTHPDLAYGVAAEDSPPTKAEKENWARVQVALPSVEACEILIEYLLQECDWLWHCADVVGTFQCAYRRQACSSEVAGLLCLYIAFPAMFLADVPSIYYKPQINCTMNELSVRLFDQVMWFITKPEHKGKTPEDPPLSHLVEPETLEAFELRLGIVHVLTFSGKGNLMLDIGISAVDIALKKGYMDESLPSWKLLGDQERQGRRRVAWNLISTCRWKLLFMTHDPMAQARVNLCRPSVIDAPTTMPVRLIERREPVPTFRMMRIKSHEEMLRVGKYRDLLLDICELMPRVQQYQMQVGKTDPDTLLAECETLWRELVYWQETKLPQAGFASPTSSNTSPEDFDDLVKARYIIQSMVLHMAFGHISANVLRYWLSVGDSISGSPTVRRKLHDACLDNAKKSMMTIPLVQRAMEARNGPIILPFVAANIFNAATTFAIPVLRAVRSRVGGKRNPRPDEEDIRDLPAWPEGVTGSPPASAKRPRLFHNENDPTRRALIAMRTASPSSSHQSPQDDKVFTQMMYPTRKDSLFSSPMEAESMSRQPSSSKPIPAMVYSDALVRECATNILIILDGLTTLNANPLGSQAEQRLSELVTLYGIRESQYVQANPPPSAPANVDGGQTPALIRNFATNGLAMHGFGTMGEPISPLPGYKSAPDKPPVTDTAGLGLPQDMYFPLDQLFSSSYYTQPANPGYTYTDPAFPVYNVNNVQPEPTQQQAQPDQAFLNSLLQMDSSIWQNLLDAGAFAPS